MLGGELAAVRCDLEDFAAEMFEPFARADQRRWGGVCLRGLLQAGGRKSVEPMAAHLGEDGNRQALAHFVTSSPWDAAHVRARLAWRMQPVIRPTALIIDDTGFLKDGAASACVTRQYTGTAGKVTNCQAGVSLHLASNNASAAVNWRLFLRCSSGQSSLPTPPARLMGSAAAPRRVLPTPRGRRRRAARHPTPPRSQWRCACGRRSQCPEQRPAYGRAAANLTRLISPRTMHLVRKASAGRPPAPSARPEATGTGPRAGPRGHRLRGRPGRAADPAPASTA
ncbi:IS701 family transposase [Streptomyces sp. NPDC001020]